MRRACARTGPALVAAVLGFVAVPAAPASLPVAEPSSPATRVNGRIFGADPVTGPFSCSGISLATPSGSIVLTAGHCVYEDGRWARNLSFVPAYDHGRRPFGTFQATAAYATPQWTGSENSDYDVGALKVARRPTGTLARTVGARPWRSGVSRFASQQVFGYPDGALAGEALRTCRDAGLGADPHTNGEIGPPPLAVRCDMAGGSSGGAWLSGGYVDGVTSYGYRRQHNRLYSPYFGPAVAAFLSSLP